MLIGIILTVYSWFSCTKQMRIKRAKKKEKGKTSEWRLVESSKENFIFKLLEKKNHILVLMFKTKQDKKGRHKEKRKTSEWGVRGRVSE